jgi:hypothetical protein
LFLRSANATEPSFLCRGGQSAFDHPAVSHADRGAMHGR